MLNRNPCHCTTPVSHSVWNFSELNAWCACVACRVTVEVRLPVRISRTDGLSLESPALALGSGKKSAKKRSSHACHHSSTGFSRPLPAIRETEALMHRTHFCRRREFVTVTLHLCWKIHFNVNFSNFKNPSFRAFKIPSR